VPLTSRDKSQHIQTFVTYGIKNASLLAWVAKHILPENINDS
jgi:hypothetical protein